MTETAHRPEGEALPARRYAPRLLLLVVVLAAIGVYANSLRNGFALDDERIVLRNEWVHGWDKLPLAVDSGYWPTGTQAGQLYRPVTTASYTVNWSLAGPRPVSYHAVNVALHAGVTACTFALLGALGAAPLAAFAGAAVFAVHPVHTEAVANIVGRAELLTALFFLLACLVYLRDWRPAIRLPLMTLLFLFAMGSKETGMALPAVLVLLEAARAPSLRAATRRLREEIPLFVVLAAAGLCFLTLRFAAMGVMVGDLSAPELEALSTSGRLATVFRIWPHYVRLMVFPRELVMDYAPNVIRTYDAFDARAMFGLLLGLVILASAFVAWRRARLIAVGVIWFALTVFLVSNLAVPIGILLAERTLYLASTAMAFITAGVADIAMRKSAPTRRGLAAVFIVILLLGAVRTWTRNPVWQSTMTLMRDFAVSHPESFRSHWILGSSLLQQGDLEGAADALGSANAIVPNHFNLSVEYATVLHLVHRYEDADSIARLAGRLIPGYSQSYLLRSNALLHMGRADEAVTVLQHGLARLQEHPVRLYDNLAYAYGEAGNWGAALQARRTSMAYISDRPSARQHEHLARIYGELGRADAAAAARERASEIRTRNPQRMP